MRACTPTSGATTAHRGAGDDLAALLHGQAGSAEAGYVDDRRIRCDPAELDDSGSAAPGAVEQAAAQLAAAQQRLQALKVVLRDVLAGPEPWLRGLEQKWQASAALETDLEQQYLAAVQAAQAAQAAQLTPDPRFCPNYTPKAVRREETAALHQRGGWRDHTDGNRIVTTRGDKLEEVRGNYRMVVLGRQHQPQDAMGQYVLPGWDASGGHIDEETVTVAEDTFIEWKRRHNGTWYTLETIAKMDTQSVSTGDSNTTSFGHFQLTMTGSEDPSDSWHAPEDCQDHHCHINPRVINESWATEMRTYTGSAKLPVPEICDTSYVDTMRSRSTSDRMTDRTQVRDAMTSTAQVSGTISDYTTARRFETSTKTNTMLDLRTTGATTELMMGDTVDTTNGTMTSLALAANANLTVGTQTDLMLAACANINIGVTSEVFIGAKADLSLTGNVSVQLGAVVSNSTAANIELALVDTRTALLASVRGIMVSR